MTPYEYRFRVRLHVVDHAGVMFPPPIFSCMRTMPTKTSWLISVLI